MPLLFVVALPVGFYWVWKKSIELEKESPDVAIAQRNLPAYARIQHARATRLEGLLREVRAEDEVLPSLSSGLRDRVVRALEEE